MRLPSLLCLCAFSLSAHAPIPIAFEPNQGQASSGVDFLAHAAGFTVALHSGSAGFLACGTHVEATLAGTRPSRAEPESPLPGTVTYLVGQASLWRHDIPTFGRVRYRGVYPGIDVVYYGNGGVLEYDFVVAPGTDPRQIRIDFHGAHGLRLDSRGDLIIDTPAGPLRQRRPVLYQEIAGVRRPVQGRYLLRGGTVRFHTGVYDRRAPLVIDPALTWATYAGTTLADESRAVTTDSAGNVYLTGSSLSTRGDTDVFVVKLDANGNLVKRVLLGGTDGNDDGYGIAVDGAGAVYVVGQSGSFQWPISITYAGLGTDAFFVKVDAALANYVYAAFFGGNGDDVAYACALDANNNLYIGGATVSTNFLVTRTGPQRTLAGGVDGFLTQVDATGTPVYSTYLGGTGDDYVFDIALDAAGNLYATGQTASTNLPTTTGAYQMASGGGLDAFVAKYAAGGSLAWLTYLGGTGDDEANGMAVDAAGSAVVVGGTASTNFPLAGAYQASNAGGPRDMFVTKLSPDGARLTWSTYLGGSGDELANGVALDTAGNVYIAGTSNSTDFPSLGAFQGTNRGNADGTITALAADGRTVQFSSYIGGTSNDFAEGVTVGCAAGLVITGTSGSNNFPATLGTANLNYAQGATSGWVAKIAAGSAAATIAAGGIVNAATSASAPVAPGSLVTIYGTNLAGTTASALTTPLATTLGGATVTVNGAAVPLIYVSPGQINFQLPYEVGPGTATATVNSGCGASAPVSFAVTAAAPYLLPGSNGDALAQNQDFTFNAASNAAAKGSVVVVYMIGMGTPDAPVTTGAATPVDRLYQTTLPAKATIGGTNAPVQFLGLTPNFVGLVQANLQVPNLSPGRYPIVVTVNGVDSNAATMYVK